MEDAYEWKGLNGQLATFKKEVGILVLKDRFL